MPGCLIPQKTNNYFKVKSVSSNAQVMLYGWAATGSDHECKGWKSKSWMLTSFLSTPEPFPIEHETHNDMRLLKYT